ncbi:aminotransferase class I and II domain-containing protein [Ditylenchus destructor]|nr:aminotransferase class I and II domain-containing protein [Ditylenchus destructor]
MLTTDFSVRFRFPYYQYSIFVPNDIKWKEYSLDMNKGEINLTSVREQIDSRTKAILLCNPHNPTGLTFSKENLEGLLEIAEEYQVYYYSISTIT